MWIYKAVTDAYEGKDFASYILAQRQGKKIFGKSRPSNAKVILPSGDEKICASSDEFDEAALKPYMQ